MNTTTLAMAAALTLIATSASAGGYVKLGDIKGESTERAHVEWIDIVEARYSGEQAGASASGAARARASASLGDVVFIKDVDRSSPKIAEALVSGIVLSEVKLEFTTPGAQARLVYSVTLTGARIVSVDTIIEADGPSSEEVALSYETIKWTHHGSGGKAGDVEASWNVRTSATK